MGSVLNVACVQLAAREVDEADRALTEALEAADEAAARADLVVLPEATYPGYVLHEAAPFLDGEAYRRGVTAFGELAARRKAWICVGLVRSEGGGLRNSAILLDPDGRPTVVADKAFLWHFDRRWYEPGDTGEVIPLPWGAAGAFVCADARMMEIPRRLAVGGARLLIDCTALVLPPGGSNLQIDYLLSVRARENGAFLAVADKCGAEAGVASYAGRSAIFDPDGERLAEAGPSDPEVIVAEVDLARAGGPIGDRRPDRYAAIARPVDRAPAGEAAGGAPQVVGLGLVAAGPRDPAPLLRELDAGLGVVHGDAAAEVPGAISVSGEGVRLDGRGLVSGDLVHVGEVALGVLVGDAGLVPEEARVLMLEGATVLLWAAGVVRAAEAVARTRASENRVFVVLIEADGAWAVFDPSGRALGTGGRDVQQASLVPLLLASALDKEMAPGTDVLRGRAPERYPELTAPGGA